jgi:membrane protein
MKKYLGLLRQTFTEFGQDKAPRLGAALAYYTIFSMAPLILIAIAIAGIVFGEEAARGGITRELGKVMGSNTAKAVEELVQHAAKPKAGSVATIVGIITLLFGASGVFGQLKDAMNTIWNVEPKKAGGVLGFVKQRFWSMAMVMGVGFLLLVTLIVDAGISALHEQINRMIPGGSMLVQAIQLSISLALITFLFAMIFRFLPDVKVAWRDVWLGAAITALLFVLGKFGLGMYLARAAPGSSFGAAGSLVILLIWVYWSSQILFLGAEFTQVYARSYGSLKGDHSKADARQHEPRLEDRSTVAIPAPVYVRKGGRAKVAAGGIAGLVLGALVGGITAMIVAVKSLRKLLTMPFR